jgi:hypothetical protein
MQMVQDYNVLSAVQDEIMRSEAGAAVKVWLIDAKVSDYVSGMRLCAWFYKNSLSSNAFLGQIVHTCGQYTCRLPT